MSIRRAGLMAGLSFLLGAIVFALTFGFLHRSGPQKMTIAPEIVKAESAPLPNGAGPNFVPVVRKVKPAVVQVFSEAIVEQRMPMFGDDFFDQFFGTPRRREKQQGMGSGFFISADGYILTNNHVVENAIKVTVATVDNKEYSAKIIGVDPRTDLALLKVDIKNQPFIDLGDSSKVEVGEWVLAIGNPLGQKFSVTSGIISAENREGVNNDMIEDFLQTDAAINKGNSGGPLVNLKGEAIGINSMILSPNYGNVGIGLAIPSNLAKKVVNDLRTKGKVTRGWLGITMGYINDKQAKEYDQPQSGILINSVAENSPAQRGGLKRYDLIIGINGNKVDSAADLQREIANTNPGDTMELKLYRNGKIMELKVKVGEAPESMKVRSGENNERAPIDMGMALEKNSNSMKREYELKTAEGLVVVQIDRRGPAYAQGIRQGDVILALNRTTLESVQQFEKLISSREPGSSVLLLINRFGDEQALRFTIPEE